MCVVCFGWRHPNWVKNASRGSGGWPVTTADGVAINVLGALGRRMVVWLPANMSVVDGTELRRLVDPPECVDANCNGVSLSGFHLCLGRHP